MTLTFVCDPRRHLVCLPYSRANLHEMARQLVIKRHFFHRDHYDIPKRREREVMAKCLIVRPRDVLRIIKTGSINGLLVCASSDRISKGS